MKKIILIAIVVFACIASGTAQECSEEFKQIEGFWSTLTIDNALNDPDSIGAGFDALKTNLTGSLSKLSFDKSLPKFLPNNGKIKKGNLKKGKKRSYVTYLVPKDSMEVVVSSTKELTGLEIMICSHNKQKLAENLIEHTFTEEEPVYEYSFYLTGLRGKILSVALRNQGDKLPYTLSFKPTEEITYSDE